MSIFIYYFFINYFFFILWLSPYLNGTVYLQLISKYRFFFFCCSFFVFPSCSISSATFIRNIPILFYSMFEIFWARSIWMIFRPLHLFLSELPFVLIFCFQFLLKPCAQIFLQISIDSFMFSTRFLNIVRPVVDTYHISFR